MSTNVDESPKCVYCKRNKARRRGLCASCGRHANAVISAPATSSPIEGIAVDPVESDLRVKRLRVEVSELKGRYSKAQERIETLEGDLNIFTYLKEHAAPVKVISQKGQGTNEATPVLVASDWHMEQKVTLTETNGLNEMDLDIASLRADRFFSAGLRLIKLLNQDVSISTVVLALLGDFITGQIHGAANAEKNQLPPTKALVFAQNHLMGGIDFLLDNSTYDFIVVCKMGNHSRNTDRSRIGVENGHSYEYLMYLFLQDHYRGESRIQFIIEDSFNSYLDIYDETFRFNHGHTIKYMGGIGGLFIPAYKKIDKWDKGRRATRTIIGHHHQYLDGGNFHCNGSLIGYDERAAGEGFAYEPPMQTLLLVDKKRGQTCKWPIYLTKGGK